MTFEQFCTRVMDEIDNYIYDTEKVILQDVVKNNGTVCKGLIVVNTDTNISPTIYLEGYYEQYMNGELFSDVMYGIADIYEENKPLKDFDISMVKEWEKAKDNIICKLINYDLNQKLLEDVPHKRVEDLAVVYMISVRDFMDEYATILIHDNIFELYGKTVDELDAVANKNVKRICPPLLIDMKEMLGIPLNMENQMYVLTNQQKINGAVHVLNPEIMDEISSVFGEKCMVIPSSVHEVIIVPYDLEVYSYVDLEEMIEDINNEHLTKDEILSNKAYTLDTKHHVLRLAENDVEYLNELKQIEEYKMQYQEEEEKNELEDVMAEEELQKSEAVAKRYEEKYQKKESNPKL